MKSSHRVEDVELEAVVDQILEMLDGEHPDCEQNTCTLSAARRMGFNFLAIREFLGSGSGSREFDDMCDPFVQEIGVRAEEESEQMDAEVVNQSCPYCSSVIWLPDQSDFQCDGCGREIPEEDQRR